MSDYTLAEAVRDFLAEKKPATARTYGYDLDRMMAGLGPARPVADVVPVDLLRYWRTLPDDWSVPTRNKHTKTLRTFFNWCVRWQLIDKSPAGALQMERLPGRIDRAKATTEKEFVAMLEYCQYDAPTPRDMALLLFAADTGCRAIELSRLCWQHVDLEHLHADVLGKGDKPGRVAFGAECAKALRRWMMYVVKHRERYGYPELVLTDYVFNRNGKRIKSANISQAMSRICERAGVAKGGIHQLRYRLGYKLGDARVAPSIAAAIMRHSDPGITMRHYYPSEWWAAEQEARKHVYDPRNLQAPDDKTVEFRMSRPTDSPGEKSG